MFEPRRLQKAAGFAVSVGDAAGNQNGRPNDQYDVEHERARELISAELDGEATATEHADLEAHLAGCSSCRAWRDHTLGLRRRLMVRPAESIPDQTSFVLRAVAVPDVGAGEWVRYALFVVAATLLLLDIPLLLQGGDVAGAEHLGRHLGAFSAALALALLYVAWRPERAIGLVPMAAVLAVTFITTAALDLSMGRSTLLSESFHLLEITGLILLWVVSGGRQRFRQRHARFPRPDRRSGSNVR